MIPDHHYHCHRWWLHMPPCARCGKSHVLIDCRYRLAWEVDHDE